MDAGQGLEHLDVLRLAPGQLLVGAGGEVEPLQPLAPQHRQPPPQLGGGGVGDAPLQLVLVGRGQLLERTGLGGEPLQLLAGLGALRHLAEGAHPRGEGQVALPQRLAEVGNLLQEGDPVVGWRPREAQLEHVHQVPDVVQAPVDRFEQPRGIGPDRRELEESLQPGHRVGVVGGDGQRRA